MRFPSILPIACVVAVTCVVTAVDGADAPSTAMDQRFERLAARYLDESPALWPSGATTLGDHRYDELLDEVSEAARERERKFHQGVLAELQQIDVAQLTPDHKVDHALLLKRTENDLWGLDVLREWEWNPINYTQLAGGAIYGLLARDFAPIEKRLVSVAARLEQFPRLYDQIRATLVPAKTPVVHVETAIRQNRGVLSTIAEMVRPAMPTLDAATRSRLEDAIETATAAVEKHQTWLEKELLPNARGDHRIGRELFEDKLARVLDSTLTRQELRSRAEGELVRTRREMYDLSVQVLRGRAPTRAFDALPSPEVQQTVIEEALKLAQQDVPPRDGVVAAANRSMEITTDFVRSRDLMTIPPDPLEIIIMPEFQRGVSVAYCDSPGPLEVGGRTFYAVSPIPADWTAEQTASFLREYNLRSIHNLSIHEAMPGHFVQIAHSNRCPSKLRALLGSGTFVEGWACYTEQMMSEEGFLKEDPLMRLVTLKWYLRSIANTILDQSIHVDRITREDAMRLMTHDTFQEEREAAGKWVRAQVTATQLSTYFVGYQEHRELRKAAEAAWGDKFTLKEYHDTVCSHGSPPCKYVRQLMGL